MAKPLFIANAVLTLPFGIVGLIIPGPVFALFGIDLDPGGQLIARGYAATLLGYGTAFAVVRNAAADGQPTTLRGLLLASALFNLAETVIPAIGGAGGLTSALVWVTVAAHGVIGILSVVALLRVQAPAAS